MNHLFQLLRRLPALAGALVLTALLSGCLLTSVDLLVADDEAVTPFPAKVAMFGYAEDPAGYALSKEPPASLTLDGKAYKSDDGALAVRFVPLKDKPDTFLVAATGEDGTIYGIGHFANSVLELRIVLGDNVDAVVEASGLSDLTVSEGGITVTTRAGLDAAIGLMLAGELEVGSIVYFIAESADAAAPPMIARDGDVLKPQS